jgi:hypothetical protein
MTTDPAKLDLWTERTEHRMTKQSLKYVTQERNQLRTALAQIAEDCNACGAHSRFYSEANRRAWTSCRQKEGYKEN